VILAGCAGSAGIRWPAADGVPHAPTLLTTVPFFSQEDKQCGPAALAMALAWSGVPVSPQDLEAQVFTPELKGSLQPAMIAATRRHDRIACLLSDPDTLVDEVVAGHPVVVLQNLGLSWYPVWHYAVVVGLDVANGKVILHSGTTPYKPTAFKTFAYTWARSNFWGLLVLPPGQLPAAANEKDYLQAVSGLERSGKWKTAGEGYQAALIHWPDSLPAAVGLGVCLYREGALASAETVFRQAAVKFPDEGVVFNNLAQVLMDRGKKAEAIRAALKAVQIGGPLNEHFQDTLDEIRSR
jgi:hypothetical protein